MALVMALFYLNYFKSIATITKELPPDKQAIFTITMIVKHIFYGMVLCVLLTLLGITSFTFGDIFICVSIIILLQVTT
jgi:hypothetical protein